jgi:molybdopterin converting factor small subunit
LIAPSYVPKVMEHCKQHIALWYLTRMNGYVQMSMGKKMEDYELLADPKNVDKLFAIAAQHVTMDSQETMQGILPVIQQMQQLAQQYKPQPQMDAGSKVLLDTSMAETQRRAKRDEAELTLQAKKDAQEVQERMAKLQQDYDLAMEEQQMKLAIATNDMELKERIETARITRDAAKLSHEQDKTVLSLINKGGNYGN